MDETYVINFDEYDDFGNYWIFFYAKISSDVTYFVGFCVQHISNKIQSTIGNKNILKNLFRVEA